MSNFVGSVGSVRHAIVVVQLVETNMKGNYRPFKIIC